MAIFSPMVTSYGAGAETGANFTADANRNILTRQAQAMMAAAEASKWRKQLEAQERENQQRYGFQREELQARLNESAQDRAARLEEAAATREQARALAEGGWAHAERLDERRGLRDDTRDERTRAFQESLAKLGREHDDRRDDRRGLREDTQAEKTREFQKQLAADADRRAGDREQRARQFDVEKFNLEQKAKENSPEGQRARFVLGLLRKAAGGVPEITQPLGIADIPQKLPGIDVAQGAAGTVSDVGVGGGLAASLERTRPVAGAAPNGAPKGEIAAMFEGKSPEEKELVASLLGIKVPKTERDYQMERLISADAETGALVLKKYLDNNPQLTPEQMMDAQRKMMENLEARRASYMARRETAPAAAPKSLDAALADTAPTPSLPGSAEKGIGAALSRQTKGAADPFRNPRTGGYFPGLVELSARTRGVPEEGQKQVRGTWEKEQMQTAVEEAVQGFGSKNPSNEAFAASVRAILAAKVGPNVASDIFNRVGIGDYRANATLKKQHPGLWDQGW